MGAKLLKTKEKILSLQKSSKQIKLKFTIRYRTSWGESLHVAIAFHSQDGTVRQQNLLMQTEDGELWTLETAALVGRQHLLSHIVYSYQVENGENQVIRKEWDMVPRLYYFDTSKDCIFSPISGVIVPCLTIFTAMLIGLRFFARRNEQVEVAQLPLFRRTIVFRVSAPQLKEGQVVAVCGSHPAIGSWNASRYLQMQYVGQHEWMLTVNALGWLMPIEYKYVVVDEQTHALLKWEEGDNRVVSDEVNDGQVLVLYGEPLRLCEDTWRAAGVVVPVFSLRSEHSYGVGDFGDLRRLVDWAVATGMKFIQVLPVNDTTISHQWGDSVPTISSALLPSILTI